MPDGLAHEFVDGRQERCERLARAGRRGDQHVAPGVDRRPRLALRRRRRSERVIEPARDSGVKILCGHE
jgi:hypothetical protein